MVSHGLSLMGQIIRIDSNTMASHQPWRKFQKVPFRPGGFEYSLCIDAETMEDERQFIHQCNIEIALGILNNLGCFCDLDARSFMDAGLYDQSICGGDDLQSFFV